MGFKFNEHKSRPVYTDAAETVIPLTDSERDELLKMMNDVNRKGCVLEPLYEEEHINKVVLPYYSDGDWQAFVETLVCNEYEVTVRVMDDDVVITWKDKDDLVEEIKREARKIEAER